MNAFGPDSDDVVLMRAIAESGDRDAFAALFRRYAPRLTAFLSRGGGLPTGHVEELVQDVMLQVWRRADRYDPSRAAVSTWVFTIARNRFIDQIRRHGRPTPEGFEPSAVPTPEQQLAEGQRCAAMTRALDSLSDEQRAAIVEVYYHQRTNAEAAARHALPTGTQKSRLRAGLETLRKRLSGVEP